MSPEALLRAHRALWREAFSFKYSVLRIVRAAFRLRLGAFLMCATMNAFYYLKRLRGNEPVNFEDRNPYRTENATRAAGVVSRGSRNRRGDHRHRGDMDLDPFASGREQLARSRRPGFR
jgi:hypothetical protein